MQCPKYLTLLHMLRTVYDLNKQIHYINLIFVKYLNYFGGYALQPIKNPIQFLRKQNIVHPAITIEFEYLVTKIF